MKLCVRHVVRQDERVSGNHAQGHGKGGASKDETGLELKRA